MALEDQINKALAKFGKLGEHGHRDDLLWYDIDRSEPLTKEDLTTIETTLKADGVFAKLINSGSSLDKKTGKEIQKIWLTAFASENKLIAWKKEFELKKKSDHRFIGEQLDWFHVQEDIVAPGMALFHPKGMRIRRKLIDLIREVNDDLESEEVWTPHMAKIELWKMSGHYEHYKDKMFIWEQDGQEWGLKAMNCPFHIQIYRFKPKSYRDLPLRYAEFGTDYRKEQSGELHGLSRVWCFTMDDHHFMVTPEQIESEVLRIMKACFGVYDIFGFKPEVKLATMPDDAMGDAKLWKKAENALEGALKKANIDFTLKEKDGAFYGPKIDIYVKDSMGRKWQLTTIQVDFFMPDNFKMSYVDANNKAQMPVMIHFAILGSVERFMSVIIEHWGGKLPLWLAPVQVKVLPISDAQITYAEKLVAELKKSKIYVELDSDGTLGKRIRTAETEKVPAIVVVGEKEVQANKVNVRGKGDLSLEDFLAKVRKANLERTAF
ncbi:MAG: threonine--tRNA ligase [Candidatus Altiarchaeota archaeon]|nr:threonine--tRNA ligase [Candidatus Altiarchaeota archaeon]